jgi:hypothetical protein
MDLTVTSTAYKVRTPSYDRSIRLGFSMVQEEEARGFV